jgi:uncharacterized protein (TIRG00374 family)
LHKYAAWVFGLLLLAVVVGLALHFGELSEFAALARGVQPQWIAPALLLQIGTYVASAAVWHRVLSAAGEPRPLRGLVPLAVAKFFAEQAIPSMGLGGTVLLMRGLAKRGVSIESATQTVLVALFSFYSAYAAAVVAALGPLWFYHKATPALFTVAAIFAVVAAAMPTGMLWLKRHGTRSLPRWIAHLPAAVDLLARVSDAPEHLLRKKSLLAETVLLQLSVFLFDALTLWVVFQALGQPTSLFVAFVSFVMASVVTTIGPVPLGLGTFEASSIGVLSLLGVRVEAALAATLLLRGVIFWLPMLPGVWLARREIAPASAG